MNLVVKLENYNGSYVVSSRIIANQLGKRHDSVLRDIDKLISSKLNIFKSPQFCGDLKKSIFPNTYKDSKNRNYREYLLTKEGFTLYMFNIQGYNDFKIAYINEFNKMEQELKNKKQRVLPFSNTMMIPIDKAKYWTKIKNLSDKAENIRKEVYRKLNLLSNMSVLITDEIDKLSNIVFETEDCINKIEKKD